MEIDSDQPAKYEMVGEFVAIYKRGRKWWVNYQHRGKQYRKSLKVENKKEARRKALLIEKELLAGDHQPQKRAPRIEQVKDQYLDFLRAEGRKPKTMAKYEHCFLFLVSFAKANNVKRISGLNITFMDKFRSARSRGWEQFQPARAKTVHNDTVTIRQLVNFALKRGMIQEDPLSGYSLKKPKRTPQPCWSDTEVQQILASATGWHQEALSLLAYTGVRVGEAKWLTWQDVDLSRHLIHIRPKDGWDPKSGDQRVVPIHERLKKRLQSLPRSARWVIPAPVTNRHSDPDRQFSERRLLQYLKRLLKPLGLKGHLHTFRHSFISWAATRGVPERVLRKWVGHVDRDVLDWYFHLADAESQAAMKRLTDTTEDEE